jgi:hypothetical protein
MSAPLIAKISVQAPAVGAGNDDHTVVGVAPFAGTVTAATYTTDTAVTGANTNTRTLTLYNRGQAGAGTTAVAALALTSGVNTVAYDEKALTLSVTAADLVVAAGDVLDFASIHAASGLADPGGEVVVTFSRS